MTFRFWRGVIRLGQVLPFAVGRNFRNDQQEDKLEQEVETTINKIFLTSEQSQFSQLKIFALDGGSLGKEIASHLDISLGRLSCQKYKEPYGQTSIRIFDSVRGYGVFILKTFQNLNLNDGIMELMLAVSCMKKQGAQKVTVILPYLPYTTPSEPKVVQGRDFYTCFAADIVKMLQAMGCDQIVTLNPMIKNPKGFAYTACLLSINAQEIGVPYLTHLQLKDPVLIAAQPTTQYLNNIHRLQKTFRLFDYNYSLGFFNKKHYVGPDVNGRDVIVYSNVIRSSRKLESQMRQLKQYGAANIYYYGFHGLCNAETLEKMLDELPIKEIIMTNTVFHLQENKRIRTISVAKFLAELITVLSEERSLRSYRGEREMLNYAFLQKIKEINRQRNQQNKKNKDRMAQV